MAHCTSNWTKPQVNIICNNRELRTFDKDFVNSIFLIDYLQQKNVIWKKSSWMNVCLGGTWTKTKWPPKNWAMVYGHLIKIHESWKNYCSYISKIEESEFLFRHSIYTLIFEFWTTFFNPVLSFYFNVRLVSVRYFQFIYSLLSAQFTFFIY